MPQIRLSKGVYTYNADRQLGQPGGFGTVYLGATVDGMEVAVKKLHVSAAEAAHRELRIVEELRGRSLEHLVPFLDCGVDSDMQAYFIIMAKAEKSLQDKLDAVGRLPVSDGAAIMLAVARGLREVGDIVHRDLKPSNILLHEGEWKIADFGIARFVEEATSANTLKDCLSPLYAAPEQWRSERATHATDLYALGCIGFCLLVGSPPFTDDLSEKHQRAPVPTFACPDARLAALISIMLRKLPEQRPTLSRVEQLLVKIVEEPSVGNAGDGRAALAAAGAQEARVEGASEAGRERDAKEQESRTDLAHKADEIIAENFERLWGKVHMHAPTARRAEPGFDLDERSYYVGDATLELSALTGYDVPLPKGLFPLSGWDVVTGRQLRVVQPDPEHAWGGSLWYAALPGSSFRWHEVSYFSLARRFSCIPSPVIDVREADLAASGVVHDTQIAFGPQPIDDENEEAFHSRWMFLLAKAAERKLGRPLHLPFEWPPQF